MEKWEKALTTVDKLRDTQLAMARATAASMTLPTRAAVVRGQAIYDKYAPRLRELGDADVVNPGHMAAVFATHDAELALLKVVLALAASKTDAGFPDTLESIAHRFGGEVPRSPYDDSSFSYQVLEGSGFRLAVREVQAGEIVLPRIQFKFEPGELGTDETGGQGGQR